MLGKPNLDGNLELGNGASFWVYISPQNNTDEAVKEWSVTLSQGNWSGTIDSNNPTKQLQTPNLSGVFTIEISQTDFSTNPPRKVAIPPMEGSKNEIGCNANCASMVGIVANKEAKLGGSNAKFWTTWDALCKRG